MSPTSSNNIHEFSPDTDLDPNFLDVTEKKKRWWNKKESKKKEAEVPSPAAISEDERLVQQHHHLCFRSSTSPFS